MLWTPALSLPPGFRTLLGHRDAEASGELGLEENYSGEVQNVWKTGFCCGSRWAEYGLCGNLVWPLLQEHRAQVRSQSPWEQRPATRMGRARWPSALCKY